MTDTLNLKVPFQANSSGKYMKIFSESHQAILSKYYPEDSLG